jgi:hypothetical protein
MKTRAERLRDKHRKIMLWSLAMAVVLHIALFALSPTFRTEPLNAPDLQLAPPIPAQGTLGLVDILFGPPTIHRPDGSTWTEPPDRFLEAERLVQLPPDCEALGHPDQEPLTGKIRLRVYSSGRVSVLELEGNTGDPCGDRALTDVASALLYHWLPNERFPAPVEVTQPVEIVAARE